MFGFSKTDLHGKHLSFVIPGIHPETPPSNNMIVLVRRGNDQAAAATTGAEGGAPTGGSDGAPAAAKPPAAATLAIAAPPGHKDGAEAKFLAAAGAGKATPSTPATPPPPAAVPPVVDRATSEANDPRNFVDPRSLVSVDHKPGVTCVVNLTRDTSQHFVILTVTPIVLPPVLDFHVKHTTEAALSPKLSIDDVNMKGRRVLIRVDFNVPIDAATGKVRDDNRIRATLPTIQKCLKDGASSVVLMSHLGRPKGKVVPKASLKPVVGALEALLGRKVEFAPDALKAHEQLSKLPKGGVLLLENLRFHPGEDHKVVATRLKTAQILAQYGDIFVCDAFGTAHRESASMTGVPRLMGAGVAGYLIVEEVNFMYRILHNPSSPFVAIIGGSKVSDKISLLGKIFDIASTVIVGGAMAFTFLEARGCHLGTSKVERQATIRGREVDLLQVARELMEKARQMRVEFLLPVDHACSSAFKDDPNPLITRGPDIPDGYMGLDVGPKTQELWSKVIAGAKTIVWNGPVGVFEFNSFKKGTESIAQCVPPPSQCLSLVGGGDTAAAVKKFKHRFAHVSTGGGATLELLEGKALPGLVCLTSKSRPAKL